ncbi:uncharacterized protein LOC131425262 [Malaya genurostris]|uniref:uncharacterized protein LOC131425262 n=1 Tax=Malaya genurostris TaxID=325434 RepID=UPI0026F3F3D4|nr:uncharacterized protein LOC131425262 [Malaya genurostris]
MSDQIMIEGKYCRLCLCQIEYSESMDPLENISVESNTENLSLLDKIRDCLGLFINANDTIIKICENCEQTINLIEEFRILCHQTDEIYESIQLQTDDPNAPKKYQEHVTELRKLIQEQRLRINRALENEELEVKDFPIEACPTIKHESFDNISEWTEDIKPTNLPGIKVESLEIEADYIDINDDALMYVSDINSNQQDQTICEKFFDRENKLKLAQICQSYEIIWNSKHPSYKNPTKREASWDKIATEFGVTRAEVKLQWSRLRDVYRTRTIRASKGDAASVDRITNEPLYKVLDAMLGDNMKLGLRGDTQKKKSARKRTDDEHRGGSTRFPILDSEQKLQLAEVCRSHEVIWNCLHPDYTNPIKRDASWDEIAAAFGVTIAEVKLQWARLRDVYRSRSIRASKGDIASDDPIINEPLYKVLDAMLGDNMKVGSRSCMSKKKSSRTGTDDEHEEGSTRFPILNPEQRLQLAEICRSHEVIWNCLHPDYNNLIKRDASWDEIAAEFGVTIAEVKLQWARLRDVYRSRSTRANKGDIASDDPIINEPLYKVLDAMLGDNMKVGLRGDIHKKQSARKRTADEHEGGSTRFPILNPEQKLQLAEIFRCHEVVWNCLHPDYNNITKRDASWDKIAAEFGVTIAEVKLQWARLRDVYRSRSIRASKGDIASDDPIINEPLYKVLDAMLGDNMKVGSRSCMPKEKCSRKGTESEHEENSSRFPTLDSDEKLQLAEICLTHEAIWNCLHPDYNNLIKRDSSWDKIAAEFGVTRAEAKLQWARLRDVYRCRSIRSKKSGYPSDDPIINEPLYKVLDAMLGDNMQMGSRGGMHKKKSARIGTDYEHEENSSRFPTLNPEQKMQLAEICCSHEIIWNCQHPEYYGTTKREEAWDEISKQLNMTCAEVKFHWDRLRSIYRTRSIRLIRGQIRKDDPILTDPLYKVLDVMLNENMQVGIRSEARIDEILDKPSETESYSSVEQRVRLAEEISKHEMIWNLDHPDFYKAEQRGNIWREIAAKFELEPHVVRSEWRRFRDYHHAQTVRISQGDLDESSADSLYKTLNQYLSLVCERASVVTKTDNTGTGQKRPMPDPTNNPTVLKRRFTGKRYFDDHGCIKVRENGSVRYHKTCELCGKQIERSLFEFHMNGHYGLTPYECTFEGCNKRYGNRVTRDRHEIMVHGEEGFRFQCDQCGEKFKQRAKYDYHYAIKHKSQEVPCGICGKLLKHKNLLKNHERIHTNSFVCKVCGKVLQKKWTLHVHMRVHTNEKPYPCELCDQRFMLKVQLKTHLSKHGIQQDEIKSAMAELNKSSNKSDLFGLSSLRNS